eukprot:scaffold412006_cov51-Attheya_sp.AAC.2
MVQEEEEENSCDRFLFFGCWCNRNNAIFLESNYEILSKEQLAPVSVKFINYIINVQSEVPRANAAAKVMPFDFADELPVGGLVGLSVDPTGKLSADASSFEN